MRAKNANVSLLSLPLQAVAFPGTKKPARNLTGNPENP